MLFQKPVASNAKRKFVFIDAAPTRHTLLLLYSAGSYHGEIMRNSSLEAGHIKTPMALQDRELSKILLVSLPEATTMREALSLQDDLVRAVIHLYG